MPSSAATLTVVRAIPLPETSATAPSETDRVMMVVVPRVARWAASRVAVMVSSEWLLVETSSRATLPLSPANTIPE